MLHLLQPGWTCWFILFLSLGLSSCASSPTTVQQAVQNAVNHLTPEQLASYNSTADQVNQWNASSEFNISTGELSFLIVGCGNT
ncbi:hypothetical protein OQJ02_01360 [Legionella sp. PATHC032]|uniref:hypothetical protein n=1 Tax=Legionella sp. PATHC032 TaxID=2992039 RepID=UPI001B10857B|nr:hypothetical protein [Legionella sp. PATHC032]MCW8420285.1 hypothetical protein [Legionella sp. PATHC032]HAZ7572976.1 hypothetical protein [Legionella pneumophila]HBA1635957.1 hypothetical protein [Legionella pneumophila]